MAAFPKIDWMIVLNEKDVIGEKLHYWHRSPQRTNFAISASSRADSPIA